ncbi:MAG: MFS transporter [Eubacteriales bacterium]|nr:MFS transporter [Eubacteriales bacterium]
MILAGCFAGLQILLLFLTSKTLLLFIAYTAALTIHATFQTHLNALSFQMEKGGLPVNFVIDRAIDSLFYSAATMIIGRTIHDAGIRMIPITNLVGCAFLIIGLLWSKALLKRTAPLSGQKNTQGTGSAEQITLSAFIRITAYTIAGSVPMLYLGVFCQLISYPLLLPSIIKYTSERMDPGEAVKGQALYTMMIALGSILGSIAGGAVLDHAGVRELLILCTVLTSAGTAVIAASTERRTLPEPARPRN